MNMKTNLFVGLSVTILMGSLLTPSLSGAAKKNQPMLVQARVNENCKFTSMPTMDFLSYDPVGVNQVTPLRTSVVLGVRCTQGKSVQIGIDAGANTANAPAGSTRAMASGSNYLGYDFYHDATYTILWTNAGAGLFSYVAPSNATQNITIHGRVPENQSVPWGVYTDTVVVTVNY